MALGAPIHTPDLHKLLYVLGCDLTRCHRVCIQRCKGGSKKCVLAAQCCEWRFCCKVCYWLLLRLERTNLCSEIATWFVYAYYSWCAIAVVAWLMVKKYFTMSRRAYYICFFAPPLALIFLSRLSQQLVRENSKIKMADIILVVITYVTPHVVLRICGFAEVASS